MTAKRSVRIIDRRTILTSTAQAAALLALFPSGLAAQEKASTGEFDAALKKLLGEAKPIEGKLILDVPEIAESGNTVPYLMSVDSPMTEKDYVKTLTILSSGNPQPGIASHTFTPESGRASVTSRMRLARTQDVVAVAELSDGRAMVAKRIIKVTIGGCGG